MNIEKIKNIIDQHMKTGEDYKKINSNRNFELISHVSRQLKDKNTYALLDCGCGRGDNLVEIKKSIPIFNKYIGIDIYAPDIEYCKRNSPEGITFICSDCLHMRIDSDSIDCVLSNQIIEHISEYKKYLSEIYRVLKPNGFHIISTPNAHCPRNLFLKLIGKKPILRWSNVNSVPTENYRGHTQEFTESEIIELAIAHNFKLVKSSPIIPSPTIRGNWLFILYRLFEYVFFIISSPFVSKGYSKNTNMLFRAIK